MRSSSYALTQPKRSQLPHVAVQSMVSEPQAVTVEPDITRTTSTIGKIRKTKELLPQSSQSVKTKAVQDDSRLLQTLRAIPMMSKTYKPSYSVMSRLPAYLKPEVTERLAAQGKNARELSRIAAIKVEHIDTQVPKGLGRQTELTM